MVKRYYIEALGKRIFDTNSFITYKHWIRMNLDGVAGRRMEDYTFFTSDAEPSCDDEECDCCTDYGFDVFEEDELADMGIDI